jgi:hypothetical protein
MRSLMCVLSLAAVFMAPSAMAETPSKALQLASLSIPATITWQDMDTAVASQPRVLEASWSRAVMSTLADNVAQDGTRYLQLPLVRIYDAKGNRLKLPADITDPAVAPERIEQALSRMEVDEDAPTLAEDVGLLRTDFDAASDLPQARAYVIDYWAEWCRTSAPFHTALNTWQSSANAKDVVLIRAGADFGR